LVPRALASTNGSSTSVKGGFDYDLIIIGAGVGGHGAALHAVEKVSNSGPFCTESGFGGFSACSVIFQGLEGLRELIS
jgi:hypothetical protein